MLPPHVPPWDCKGLLETLQRTDSWGAAGLKYTLVPTSARNALDTCELALKDQPARGSFPLTQKCHQPVMICPLASLPDPETSVLYMTTSF